MSIITGKTIANKIIEVEAMRVELKLGVKLTGEIDSELLQRTMDKYQELIDDIEFVLETTGEYNEQ